MNIYTSYFRKYKTLKDGGYIPISIARYSPNWIPNILEIKELAPTEYTRALYNKDTGVGKDEYIESYKNQIRKLHYDGYRIQKRILQVATRMIDCDIEHIAKKHNIEKLKVVLMCYEKPPHFCHREIVREYFCKQIGYMVDEI